MPLYVLCRLCDAVLKRHEQPEGVCDKCLRQSQSQ